MTLQSERVQILADVRAVIDGNDRLDYQFTDREAAYEFIRRPLVRFDYPTLSKPDKGVIGRYLAKMTGLSRAQMTRLVGQHRATGRVTDRRGGAPVRPFERRYTGADDFRAVEPEAHGLLLQVWLMTMECERPGPGRLSPPPSPFTLPALHSNSGLTPDPVSEDMERCGSTSDGGAAHRRLHVSGQRRPSY